MATPLDELRKHHLQGGCPRPVQYSWGTEGDRYHLGDGWQKMVFWRQSGTTAGRCDIYIHPPKEMGNAFRCRSNIDLAQLCYEQGVAVDPSVVNFQKDCTRPLSYEEFQAGTKKLTDDLLKLCETDFAEEPQKPKQRRTKNSTEIVVLDEAGKPVDVEIIDETPRTPRRRCPNQIRAPRKKVNEFAKTSRIDDSCVMNRFQEEEQFSPDQLVKLRRCKKKYKNPTFEVCRNIAQIIGVPEYKINLWWQEDNNAKKDEERPEVLFVQPRPKKIARIQPQSRQIFESLDDNRIINKNVFLPTSTVTLSPKVIALPLHQKTPPGSPSHSDTSSHIEVEYIESPSFKVQDEVVVILDDDVVAEQEVILPMIPPLEDDVQEISFSPEPRSSSLSPEIQRYPFTVLACPWE